MRYSLFVFVARYAMDTKRWTRNDVRCSLLRKSMNEKRNSAIFLFGNI